jgi:hypothetical protein
VFVVTRTSTANPLIDFFFSELPKGPDLVSGHSLVGGPLIGHIPFYPETGRDLIHYSQRFSIMVSIYSRS